MKKIVLLLSVLIFWGSCQTSPLIPAQNSQNSFAPFKIKKIVEAGIEEVQVSPSKSAWPDVSYQKSETSLAVNSQTLVMAVIGDTGCRLKETKNKNSYQKCQLSEEWPFPKLAEKLANEKYDFLIHTGDYHYREHCSDPKICAEITKSIGYNWNAWWDDFYGPAQLLFQKSPLLAVRGNHESCPRAFSGWGPLSAINKNFKDSCEPFEPVQWIEIGDLVLLNFDDSAFDDAHEVSESDNLIWLNQFQQILKRIDSQKNKKEIWLLTHKPVYGYTPADDDAEPEEIKPLLKNILDKSGLLKKIDYVLSGHIHNQQIVLAHPEIKQLIVGHSGSALDPFGRKIFNRKLTSTTESKYSFGYALFERQGFKKWKWIFKNKQSETVLTCSINQQKIKCDE